METFDQAENKKDFKKIIWIVVGVAVLAGFTVLFIFLGRGSKETVTVSEITSSELLGTGTEEEKPIFSPNVASWLNYFWPERINTKYPGNWQFEELKTDGDITGLRITPPTGDPDDAIYIGGATCAQALKYSSNKCLRNKIQVPFYTDSQNEEVLAAFDLIFQNTILTEEGK